jgi:hypothetical protein
LSSLPLPFLSLRNEGTEGGEREVLNERERGQTIRRGRGWGGDVEKREGIGEGD